MIGDQYLDLIKVFYANLKVMDDVVCFRVKGVNIRLDEDIWISIVGFCPGGKAHLGILGLNKLVIYKGCLRYPNEPRDYTLYCAEGMKRDDRLCTFVLTWIVLPRGSNHAQLTIEDICLIHALKGKIHTNQPYVVSDNMIKGTRLPMASLPYVVFLSRVFEYYNVDLVDEVTRGYNRSNMIAKPTLHHIGMTKSESDWAFKDEHQADKREDVDHVNVDMSTIAPAFCPKNDFEKHMLKQLQILVANLSTYMTRFDTLDKEIASL